MKTIRDISLVLLFCAVVLPLASGQSAEQSKATPGCAVANRHAGYALDIDLVNATTRTKVYDVDYQETQPHHDPICLSKKDAERVFWLSGSGRQFKLRIHPRQDPDHCGQHPFQQEPPQDSVYGYLSGPLKADVPVNCVYDVEFHKEGEKPSDPHIKVVP